jgi:organic hydroperoxide reductase OsmC/OhrA
MTTQKVISVVNGVNVGAVNSTVDAIKGKPDIAKFRFHLHNKWINGGHNRSTVNSFYGANQENSHLKTFQLEADEPPMLAGEDLGANPVEHLLHALSSCLTTTLIYHAAIRGIKIEELESELEGISRSDK